jgi:hypothetical protein
MLDSVNTRLLYSGEGFFRAVKFKILHISPIYLLIKDQEAQIFQAPILETGAGGGGAIQQQHLVL